jgi:putative DNA methylase
MVGTPTAGGFSGRRPRLTIAGGCGPGKFLHMLGIHGDAAASRRRIDSARRKGERFEGQAYSYSRAFTYAPSDADRSWARTGYGRLGLEQIAVLDPTAGGGAIPFESARLGFDTFGNDLNPVAALIERATIELPLKHGLAVLREFERIASQYLERREKRLLPFFPPEPAENAIPTNFIWARTVRCPHCEGLVPLSPNWRLAPDGTGVRLLPEKGKGPGDKTRHCVSKSSASPRSIRQARSPAVTPPALSTTAGD